MNLLPYASVDGIPFSASRDDVLRRRGPPPRQGRNVVGLNELDYDDVVFRFQDAGRLEEITARAPLLHIGSVSVPFAVLAAYVRAGDPSAFERAGFLVSPKYGVAFDPRCPSWVTALAAHCLDAWRAL